MSHGGGIYTQGASTIATLQLTADTINFWTRDSIIIPCTPKAGGGYEFVDGYDYIENPAGAVKGILQLVVTAVDIPNARIDVAATNGQRTVATNDQTAKTPSLPAGTMLIRMDAIAAEGDAMTETYLEMPSDMLNYVQKVHSAKKVTREFLQRAKEVSWGEAEIDAQILRGMGTDLEKDILTGQRVRYWDPSKRKYVYKMGGFLYYNTNEYKYAVNTAGVGFDVDDIRNITKTHFTGNNGSKERVMLMGSGFTARLQKLLDDNVQAQRTSLEVSENMVWGLSFTGIKNTFGKLNARPYYTLDRMNMADSAIVIDTKHIALIDVYGYKIEEREGLVKAGLEDVSASYITRATSFELRNPATHMLISPEYA